MNITTKQYPFYIKSTVILFGLMLLVFALFTLKGIIAPIAFALIIAILLNPLVGKFLRRKLLTCLQVNEVLRR